MRKTQIDREWNINLRVNLLNESMQGTALEQSNKVKQALPREYQRIQRHTLDLGIVIPIGWWRT
jgi:hypothetical protein